MAVRVWKSQADDGSEIPVIGYAISLNFKAKEFNQLQTIDAFKKNNLDTSKITKGMTRICVVERALQKAKKGNLMNEIGVDPNDSNITLYQITEKVLSDSGTSLLFNPKEFISYYHKEDKVVAQTPETQSVLNELMVRCAEVFTNNDIFKYTMGLFNETGIVPLRDKGGVYFVPVEHRSLVENVQKMFCSVDPKGSFNIIELPDLKNSRQSVANSFEGDMATKLKTFKEKIELLKSNGTELSKTRLKGMMEEIATWSKDIEMYKDITQYTLSDCDDMMKEGNAVVQEFLSSGTVFGQKID